MEPVLGPLTLIDLAVIGGVAFVLPAALGGSRHWWLPVAGAVVLACLAGADTVAGTALALPWVVLTAALAARHVARCGRPRAWTRAVLTGLLASCWALVAATWFAISRAGGSPFGIHEPIVELTAVHFVYAGVGALVLAAVAVERASGARARRLALAGLAFTAAAPPVVAFGFVSRAGVAQVGGAVLLSVGVFATALVELHEAASDRTLGRGQRALLAVSGLAVWAPMVLAVSWAAGQHVDVPALSVPDMVRTHGAVNAIAFIGAGLVARRRDLRPLRPRPGPSARLGAAHGPQASNATEATAWT